MHRALIFADWLEENGQAERAEFIRVQCELGDAGRSGPTCRDRGYAVPWR